MSIRSATSPGHQAGAPLRPLDVQQHVGDVARLPPAIRPGAPLRHPVDVRRSVARYPASPGHQAGAPLRLVRLVDRMTVFRASPGHQAGAPLRLGRRERLALVNSNFPRPSGRGSIAATSPTGHRRVGLILPPAIRPGLHCGSEGAGTALATASYFPRPSGRGSIAAEGPEGDTTSLGELPPAIRSGLHCGW